MSKLFATFVICLLTTIMCRCVWGQVCSSAGLRKFDSNIAGLITVGNSGRSFPENKGKELKKYCDQTTDYINEIESYKSRCFPEEDKYAANVLVYAVKNAFKQICKKDSHRLNELITATPCVNLGNSEINKCYTQLIDAFLGIQNEPNDKKKVPFLCCEYHKLFPCIETRLKRISKCNEASLNNLVDFVRGIVGNMIDLFCNDYTEGSEKCANLGSPPKKKKNQRRTKSFAIPMINVLKSFKVE